LIKRFFARWRPRHLLLAWCAYWMGLILVTLNPLLRALWRISKEDAHGRVNGGFMDGVFQLNVIESGQTTWSGSISFLHLTLLVAVPPLVIWLAWVIGSSRTNNADEIRRQNQEAQRELHGTEPRIGIIDTSSSSPSKRRVREES
jgi:hypothetical protein